MHGFDTKQFEVKEIQFRENYQNAKGIARIYDFVATYNKYIPGKTL